MTERRASARVVLRCPSQCPIGRHHQKPLAEKFAPGNHSGCQALHHITAARYGIARYPNAAIARSTLSCGLTLTWASAIMPCSSITKWLRMIPMNFLPIKDFWPHTP